MKMKLKPGISLAGLAILSNTLLRYDPRISRIVIPLLPLLFVMLFPFTRKHESLYVFVTVILALAIPNAIMAQNFITEWLFIEDASILNALHTVLGFFVLISIEELVYLFITRMLYRKQRSIF